MCFWRKASNNPSVSATTGGSEFFLSLCIIHLGHTHHLRAQMLCSAPGEEHLGHHRTWSRLREGECSTEDRSGCYNVLRQVSSRSLQSERYRRSFSIHTRCFVPLKNTQVFLLTVFSWLCFGVMLRKFFSVNKRKVC